MSRSKVTIWDVSKQMINVLLTNTIETYPPEWRLIHEPLQNAIDSFLDDKGRPIAMGGREPAVDLRLGLGSNTVTVRDNGRGIRPQDYTKFLILGDGTKSLDRAAGHRQLLKGSQGVGIKSTVFTSELFKIRTVSEGELWEMDLPGFSAYSDPDFGGEVQEPTAVPTEETSGTAVTVRLKDYSVSSFVKDRLIEFFETADLDYGASDPLNRIPVGDDRWAGPFDPMKILSRYFRKDSYVGCVSRSIGVSGLPEVRFNLEVVADFAPELQPEYNVKGTHPWVTGTTSKLSDRVAYLDYAEIISQLPPRERPQIVTDYVAIMEGGRKFDRPTVFYKVLSKADVERLLGNLRKRHRSDPASADLNVLEPDPAVVARNRTALDRVNGAILFVASRRFQRTVLAHSASITLSVNGLPTGILLEFTGSELGYVPSVHLVLDVDETLGYGKRNLAPRSKGVYNALGRDLWQTLHKLARYLVAEDEEFDWTAMGLPFDRAKEFHTVAPGGDPLRIKLEKYLGRTTLPETEEDVVGSYFFLSGLGRVPRYRFLRLNDRTIYDGLAALPAPPEAFGELEILQVEFKRTTTELCKADESRRQRFEDIQLAIVWEASPSDELPPEYASVTRESDIGFPHYRPSVNYRLKRGRNSVQVLALKDVFDALP